jgi:hypothetical protein
MDGLLGFLPLALLVGAILFAFRQSIFGAGRTTTTVRTEGKINGPGTFECEVVGESRYQTHLEHIAGGRGEFSAELRKQAILALEDDNPKDDKAVCVRIDGLRVGYLSRKMARSYREQLAKQGAPTGHYWCEALIVGGWDRGAGDRGHFGVRLDLPIDD